MRRWRIVIATVALAGLVGLAPAEGQEATGATAEQRAQQVLRALAGDRRRAETGAEAAVSSPYGVLDATGDAFPNRPRGDLTGYRIRNGNVIELTFWLLREPDTWNTAPTGALLPIDLAVNGRGNDFDLIVVSSEDTGKVGFLGPPRFTPDEVICTIPNVSDLGHSALGWGFSVRFNPRCIGGSRAFRSRAFFLYFRGPNDDNPTVDVVPDRTWTPNVRPA
jgi:hypothetical protein